MNKKESVLVAIPTNQIKHYCLGKFLNALNNLKGCAEIVFADDTHPLDKCPFGNKKTEVEKYSEVLKKTGYNVISVEDTVKSPTPPRIRQRLVNARNCLRNYFLRSKHTHMLFIDSDVIVPEDAIEMLLKCNADIATGIYWQKNKQNETYIVAFKYQDDESYHVGLNEYGIPLSVQDLVPTRVIGINKGPYIAAIGFGCCLLSLNILGDDNWRFRWKDDEPEKQTTEDMWWSMDVIKLGYQIAAHTGVLCHHYPKAWEGPV